MLTDSLKGLKVIELATVLAGPAVGMFFAELGAEVIKIENKRTGGDPTRGWKSIHESKDDPASAYYHCVNWNKEIVFLDLAESSDRSHLSAFLQSADVLIVNFKEGDAEKFDLKSSVLLERYPSLIIGEIHGFDAEDRVAYDAVLQAESGMMSINGNPGDDPLKLPLAFIDILAAHQLKEGVLLALWKREKSGSGAIVSTSLYQAALASLINQSSAYLNTNVVPSQLGSLHPNIAPYGEKVMSKDHQPILLAVGTDGQFRNLCKVLESQSLAKDIKFLTNADRVKNRIDLQSDLTTLFSKHDASVILSKLHQAKVPAAKIRKLDEVLNDSLAKEMVLEQVEPNGKISKRMATVAFKIASI
ncbi:MAG: CoA transferase [Bacteroidia bacterium]|jgi:crotonobetainyl-CoA:carnitine CoA-transferase CaiB-like acyl-CoA transferase|nr:CoA transferase [Bacteroidia bacterium]